MTDYGFPDAWLSYLVVNPIKGAAKSGKEVRPDDGLANLLGDKVRSLASILSEVEQEVAQRVSLSASVRRLIYQHYSYVKTKLLELERWPLSSDRAIEARRSKLEDKLDQLLEEVRREHVQCWQDSARLKTEFWIWFKQYSDLAQRVRLVLAGEEMSDTPTRNGQNQNN